MKRGCGIGLLVFAGLSVAYDAVLRRDVDWPLHAWLAVAGAFFAAVWLGAVGGRVMGRRREASSAQARRQRMMPAALFVMSHVGLVAIALLSGTRYRWMSPERQADMLIGLVQAHDPDGVALAVRRGAKIGAATMSGDAAVHVPADAEMVQALVRLGADVNQVDGAGRTPLMAAVQRRAPEAARAWLAAGARVDVARSDGATALSDAEEQDDGALVDLLRRAGARSDRVTAASGRPLPDGCVALSLPSGGAAAADGVERTAPATSGPVALERPRSASAPAADVERAGAAGDAGAPDGHRAVPTQSRPADAGVPAADRGGVADAIPLERPRSAPPASPSDAGLDARAGCGPAAVVQAYLAAVQAQDAPALSLLSVGRPPGFFAGANLAVWRHTRPPTAAGVTGFVDTRSRAATLTLPPFDAAGTVLVWSYQLRQLSLPSGSGWRIVREWAQPRRGPAGPEPSPSDPSRPGESRERAPARRRTPGL